MNFFHRIFPWFIQTKDDQRGWYRNELSDIPKETLRILTEFQEVNTHYNNVAASFENEIQKTNLYDMYIEMKSAAQKASFLWQRLEYKRTREVDLQRFLREIEN